MDRNPWILWHVDWQFIHPCLNIGTLGISHYARYDGRNARMYLGGRDIHLGGWRGGGCRTSVPKVGTNKSWGEYGCCEFPPYFFGGPWKYFPVFEKCERDIWKKKAHTLFFWMFVWIHVTSCGWYSLPSQSALPQQYDVMKNVLQYYIYIHRTWVKLLSHVRYNMWIYETNEAGNLRRVPLHF